VSHQNVTQVASPQLWRLLRLEIGWKYADTIRSRLCFFRSGVARRNEHVSPLLCVLHWLRVFQLVGFHLVCHYVSETAPQYHSWICSVSLILTHVVGFYLRRHCCCTFRGQVTTPYEIVHSQSLPLMCGTI